MVWRDRFSLLLEEKRNVERNALRVNEICFIRKDHKCGKLFGASKSCFIACPTQDEIEPILNLISEKLAKVGIETIIAVKERAYGQDIFCTKICGKIIESKFCMVVLDDNVENKINIPNPNVYYEYGLMTSLSKHIIPLQREDLSLAFNIQSYDTVKYLPKNIGAELDRAIKDIIRITEEKENVSDQKNIYSEKPILINIELAGLELKNDDWILNNIISDTNYLGFEHIESGFYCFIGKVDKEKDATNYLQELKIVLYRTEKKLKELEQEIDRLEQKNAELDAGELGGGGGSIRGLSYSRLSAIEIERIRETMQLMSEIYIGYIMNVDVDRFLENVQKILTEYPRFKVNVSSEDELILNDECIIKLL